MSIEHFEVTERDGSFYIVNSESHIVAGPYRNAALASAELELSFSTNTAFLLRMIEKYGHCGQ